MDHCLGFYSDKPITFCKGTDDEFEANPKVLLNAEKPGMDSNDNLIWYSEPHFRHGDIVGTSRHAQCLRVSYKGMMENSTCKFCFSIVTLNSFRKRLQRRHKQECIDSPSKKEAVNYKYRERNDLLKVLNEKGKKIRTLETKCTLLIFENLRFLNHKQGWKIKMKNLANGNDGAVGEVASILIKQASKIYQFISKWPNIG